MFRNKLVQEQPVPCQDGFMILKENDYDFICDELNAYIKDKYNLNVGWIKKTFEERLAEGKEPENVDKEFLRLWFVDNCDPYNDEELPSAPDDLVVELSNRYIYLYETITGERFPLPSGEEPIAVSYTHLTLPTNREV